SSSIVSYSSLFRSTFRDVRAVYVRSIDLNGASIDPATIRDGRLELSWLLSDNTVVGEATMGYSNDGQGLHRAVDPADGLVYLYGHLFLDAAPRVFACFDQDRKSTRLNSSHVKISYAVFCLKKKKK